MSTAPKRSTVASTHAFDASGSPVFAACHATSPCMSAAAFSRASALRDVSITEAPASANAAAMALPMPRDAPVTSATFPSSRSSLGGTLRPGRLRAGGQCAVARPADPGRDAGVEPHHAHEVVRGHDADLHEVAGVGRDHHLPAAEVDRHMVDVAGSI